MKNIYKALADFQRECPIIHKETQGFNYTYADLPHIFDKIMPILGKHGLGFTQLMMGKNLKTVLFHVDSGESIESEAEIPQNVKLNKMNDFQVAGSAITYFRRYALSAILGIVTDKDTDCYGKQELPNVEQPQDAITWAKENQKVSEACRAMGLSQPQVKDAVEAGGYNELKVLSYLNQIANAK